MSGALWQLRDVIERHCRSLRGNVQAMAAELNASWRGGPDRQEAMRVATDIAHRMAGAGGSIGFDAVSTAAGSLERELRPLIRRSEPLSEIERERILVLFDELERIIIGLSPEQSSLYRQGSGNEPDGTPGGGHRAR